MATVAQIIKYALQEILTQASESPLEADEYQDCIFALNAMMNEYEGQGLNLGWSDVSNLGDEITSPTSTHSGIISNLAIRVAPQFMGSVTPQLMDKAARGEKLFNHIGVELDQTEFPSGLPLGSGNDRWNGYKFYQGAE
jgi:hypothetical protein